MSDKIYAIDIGGTYIKYAVFENLKIINSGKWKTVDDRQDFLQNFQKHVPDNLQAICVSSGGFWKNNKSVGFESISCTASGELFESIARMYYVPLYVENDAICALAWEKEYGVLKDCTNACMAVLGTSLGCAVKIDKKIYKGSYFKAGAMFLMPETVDNDDYIFDNFANSKKAVKECDKENFKELFDSIQHDKNADKLYKRYIYAVALKCWYMTLAYDCEVIAFGGAIASNDKILNDIKIQLQNIACEVTGSGNCEFRLPQLKKAKTGNNANLLGACLLAYQ